MTIAMQNVKSRPAAVGDKLITHNFGTGTGGFASADDHWHPKHRVAIFRQINKETECTHHDALEFPDGEICLLTYFPTGQLATVIQLPAAPKTEQEAKDQTRLEVVG